MKKILMLIFGLYIAISPCQMATAETFDTVSSPLLITEILPNPKGADSGQEWVELYNTTKQRISLSNWKLDNGKIFTIPDGLAILPNGYFILQGENLKITLKNSNSTIDLINPSGKTVQTITYQKTTEGQSYSLINIKSSTKTSHSWIWTIPTKGQKNQIFYSLTGEIITPPQIDKDFYFEIKSSKNNYKITFSEERFKFELLQTLLTTGVNSSFLIEKSQGKNILKEFKIINQKTAPSNSDTPKNALPSQKSHWEYILIFPIGLLILFLIYLSKKAPIQTSSSPS